jgi:2-dehydropantoate 2-reductase
MAAAGLNPEIYANPLDMKWSKLLTNLLTNASSAILDLSPAEIFEDKALFRLEMLQLREALAVMRALDLGVVDLPGTPVRALAFAARRISPSLSRPLMAHAVGRGRGGKMPSLHIDLHSGRGRSEVSWLNGAVLRHGEALGVSTPVNRVLFETLSGLVSGDLDVGEFSKKPVKLLAELD